MKTIKITEKENFTKILESFYSEIYPIIKNTNKITTNCKLGSIIMDLNFIYEPITDSKTLLPYLHYKIGKLKIDEKEIDVYVDPVMTWKDTRIIYDGNEIFIEDEDDLLI